MSPIFFFGNLNQCKEKKIVANFLLEIPAKKIVSNFFLTKLLKKKFVANFFLCKSLQKKKLSPILRSLEKLPKSEVWPNCRWKKKNVTFDAIISWKNKYWFSVWFQNGNFIFPIADVQLNYFPSCSYMYN